MTAVDSDDGPVDVVRRHGRRFTAFVGGFIRGYTWSHHLDMGPAAEDRDPGQKK